jgi:hypothetical protein
MPTPYVHSYQPDLDGQFDLALRGWIAHKATALAAYPTDLLAELASRVDRLTDRPCYEADARLHLFHHALALEIERRVTPPPLESLYLETGEMTTAEQAAQAVDAEQPAGDYARQPRVPARDLALKPTRRPQLAVPPAS